MSEIRTLQREDLFELRFLNGGQLSPDQTRVVYYVAKIEAADDKEYSTIFTLDRASSNSRQLTNGRAKDTIPVWSPDGNSIAFVSDRSGKAQLYLLPVDGGEARQLTQHERGIGIGGFAWSPDGNSIAYCAAPNPEPPNLSREPYRVDRVVYRFDAIGYLDDQVQDIFLLDLESGQARQLTDDRSNNINPRWSPDGATILYDANMGIDAERAITPDLMTVDLDGNCKTVLQGWTAISAASFTPDGEKVVFVGRPTDGKPIGTKSDLYVLDLATSEVDCRTAGLKVGVGGYLSMDMPVAGISIANTAVSADGAYAYTAVQAGGTNHIYRVTLDGDEAWEAVTSGDCAIYPQSLVGDALLYARTELNAPPDLWLVDCASGNNERLTELNAGHLARINLPETEHLLWPSDDGVQVEGWYMKPAIGSAPYPTILYIHGGPHAAYGCAFHFDFQMLAGAGYGVLFLNHRASTGYGDEFSTAIKGDWGNLDYKDLMSGVDHAIALGLADAGRLGVCGTSGGGNLSCWVIGQTARFKAAIPQNPVTNWRSFYGTSDIGIWFGTQQMGGHPQEIPDVYERCSPITYAHNCTTPTLMVQSELDWRCPAEQSEQYYTVLKANGCVVEMLRQPGGAHGASIYGEINLRRAHNDAMLDWFARYVLEEER